MSDSGFGDLYRFRHFFGGLLIIACLPLVSVLISLTGHDKAQAQSNESAAAQTTANFEDNPNLIADGFGSAWDSLDRASASTIETLQNVNDSVKQNLLSVAKTAAESGKFIARGAYSGSAWAAHGVGAGVSFVAHTPIYTWHGISGVAHIGNIINPSQNNKVQAPQIDPVIAAEIANSKPALSAVVQSPNESPQWPIHGIITEEFGVPHMPYQPIHTGIDISDAAAPGVTAIKPFKSGRVLAVIHSSDGFGNHVIIDHGSGLLSLYGHMYSTAVQVGQMVDENTTLGLEGSTGLSTGVHVHFEIDLNGQPVNPHLYVPGQP